MSLRSKALTLGVGALCSSCALHGPPSVFVSTDDARFVVTGHAYRFVGANFWYGHALAARGDIDGRARVRRELDRLQALGVNNLRILGGSEGPNTAPYRVVPALQTAPGEYDEGVADGLDFVIAEMKSRGMRAVVCLNNFWFWSGGMAQYVAWFDHAPIPYWIDAGNKFEDYARFTARFYESAPARAAFLHHVAWILGRRNAYTGIVYRDEPAIMAWELANEPRGVDKPDAMRTWIDDIARFIKEHDPNHLVTTGSEGSTRDPKSAGLNFELDHGSRFIDYATLHIWVQNWGLYDPKGPPANFESATRWALSHLDEHVRRARAMGKPLVLEEFGLSRDGGAFDASQSTLRRDAYFDALFSAVARDVGRGEPIMGANFWAWSGEGRPREAGRMWKLGDALLGDPPHEQQGWYGVYDSDASTLSVIRKHARAMAASR